MILANFKLNVHSTAEIQHEIDLKIYTRADSVGELDAEDVQRHGEVHRQPQVRRHIGDSTPDVNVITAATWTRVSLYSGHCRIICDTFFSG